MKTVIRLALAASFLLPLVSCENYDYNGDPKLIVTLSDATADQFTSLETSVKEVGIYDGEWTVFTPDLLPFDVMELTGGEVATLVNAPVPEGEYSKLKIVFGDDNYLTVADEGTERKMTSGADDLTWICDIDYVARRNAINVGSVDLDVAASVTYDEAGDSYAFSPAKGCRLMDPEGDGAVSAVAFDTGGNVITDVVQVLLCDTVGNLLRTSYCSTENGKFFYRLAQGAYDIRFVPQDSAKLSETVVEDVEIMNGELTSLGAVVLYPKSN